MITRIDPIFALYHGSNVSGDFLRGFEGDMAAQAPRSLCPCEGAALYLIDTRPTSPYYSTCVLIDRELDRPMVCLATSATPSRCPAQLDAVIAALHDRYGPHIIRWGADLAVWPVSGAGAGPPLSTGSLGFDLITGGLPPGGITELAGLDGSGKGTLALAALAACQRNGGLALLIDADGAVDPDSLVAANVDIERLLLSCPTTAAEAWDIALALCRTDALRLVVLASLPGLLALPGADARPYRPDRGLALLQGALRGRGTAFLLINGADTATPRTPLGRSTVARVATLRLALDRRALRYCPHGDVVALRVLARVVKHRGLPRDPAFLLDITPSGPRRTAELVTLGLLIGCLTETSLGLIMDERMVGRTPERAAVTLEDDPDLGAGLERRIRAAWDRRRTPSRQAGGHADGRT